MLSAVIPTDHASVSPLPHTPWWWWSCVPTRALPPALRLEICQLVVVNAQVAAAALARLGTVSVLNLKWQDLPHFDIRQNRD